MKVIVPLECVVDHSVKVRVKADNRGVDLANVKMALNPFCGFAEESPRVPRWALVS